MGFKATVLRVLIASPSDVSSERDKVEKAIFEWNTRYSEEFKIVLLPGRWENDVVPTYLGNNPQQIINEQLVNKCDILIGVFWTKLGTPTLNHTSGTLEEISIFINQKKEVMLYFVEKDVPRSADFSQLQKVDDFKKNYSNMGIYFSFDETKIIDHLYKKVINYRKQNTDALAVDSEDMHINNTVESVSDIFRLSDTQDNRKAATNRMSAASSRNKTSLNANNRTFVQILRKDLGLGWLEGARKNKPKNLNFLMGFPYEFSPSLKSGDRFLVCIREEGNRLISYISAEVDNYYAKRLVKEIVDENRSNQVDFGFDNEVDLLQYLRRYDNNKNVVCITLRNIEYSTNDVAVDQLKPLKYGLYIFDDKKIIKQSQLYKNN